MAFIFDQGARQLERLHEFLLLRGCAPGAIDDNGPPGQPARTEMLGAQEYAGRRVTLCSFGDIWDVAHRISHGCYFLTRTGSAFQGTRDRTDMRCSFLRLMAVGQKLLIEPGRGHGWFDDLDRSFLLWQ